VSDPDPVRSNLKITLAHHELSERLRAVTGQDSGANFHSWAVWGSKKAGVTIRREDLDEALVNASWVAGAVGLMVGEGAGVLGVAPMLGAEGGALAGVLIACGVLGAACGAAAGRALARWSRARAADLILEGNRLVLRDIGGQTARFCERFYRGPIGPTALAELLEGMEPGPAESGGQDLLREVFTQYARAAGAKTDAERHVAMYHANCLAILNEHLKLQPYIAASMPMIVRRCVTQRMLCFHIGAKRLAVSEDVVPLGDTAFPETLQTLGDADLEALLERYDTSKGTLVDSRAQDWTQLEDRMGYIVNLFRCFHLDPSVHLAPYDAGQAAVVRQGGVPEGPL